ncbi:MAG: transglutaminase family protein, partial [Acidobacteria bacterium]|nr:transglutaminase family protein [Acidobacteriota bacterium]
MKIAVRHTTVYLYEVPVFLEPQIIRLRPRVDGSQLLNGFRLEVAPAPKGLSEYLDQDGNVVTEVWFEGLAGRLTVSTCFEVETLRENPFVYLLPEPGTLSLPMFYPDAVRPLLAPYIHRSKDGDSVEEFARSLCQDAGWQLMPFLSALTGCLYTRTNHIIRDEGPPLEPAVTLSRGEGSCRDLAVLFCAACRAFGIAARFVSGYELGAANRERAYMHAWAEVYIPGGGWRGFDPSRGLTVSTGHVPVAASASPTLATPISGTYRSPAKS